MLAAIGLFLLSCNLPELRRDYLRNQFSKIDLTEHKKQLSSSSIHFWTGGVVQKDPLLILHGFGGDALFTWSGNIEALAKDRPIILPDLLWFGDSISHDKPSLETQTKNMIELMSLLGHEKFDVMGLSYGGLIAMHMASIAPEKIDQMIIVNSPGPFFNNESIEGINKRFNVTSIKEIFIPESSTQVQRLIDLCYYQDKGPKAPRFILDQIYEESFQRHKQERIILIQELLNEGNRNKYLGSTGPWPNSMVVWGSHDKVFPIETGSLLAKELNGPFVVIDKGGHAPNIEHAKQFNRITVEFLNDN